MARDDDDDEPVIEELDDDQIEEVSPLPQVAQSEHDIIMMARALVAGPDSNDDIWALLCASRAVAPKIGETCEEVGSSRVDLQACKLEYSIVSPK